MSNYEGMNGEGLVMKKDLSVLKKGLIDAHNRDIAGLTPKELSVLSLKKASNRTKSFPILHCRGKDEIYEIGQIDLNPEKGGFRFSIEENNHSVDDAETSKAFGVLMRFMNKLPDKGKKYGARTYYWSEYDEDGYGNKGPGTYQCYGAWR